MIATSDRQDRAIEVPLRRRKDLPGLTGPAFRVHITRCEPLELDDRRYPGWSIVAIRDGSFTDLDLSEVDTGPLAEITESAALIAAAHLPKPANPDDRGIGITWGVMHVGPVPDALADVVAQALAYRLGEIVPELTRAARKFVAELEAGGGEL